ncbi:MAG: hypothetical protein WD401_03180 [Thermomicrobiaceae bacterium]
MLTKFRTGLKYLTYGVLIGIFFAPDRGADSRRKVINWVTSGFRDVVGNVTGSRSQ